MRTSTLLARNLAWYWRTNLAVLLGVATATGVLAGALLVGDSVRASLRDLVLNRLGNVDSIVTRDGFFRAHADDIPVIAIQGVAAHEPSGRRASNIQVYGIDERFWKFQGEPGEPPQGREILLSAALAQELGGKPEDTILLRVEKPSAIPLESLHGRKEDVGKTMRLLLSGVARRDFSLRAQQGDVRAAYVPLARLQRELAQPTRVNTVLVAQASRPVLLRYTFEDLGLRLRRLESPACWSLESDSGVISDALAEAAQATTQHAVPVLTYLANGMRVNNREVPYSLVTATDAEPAPSDPDGITLNEWAAKDLAAKIGDKLTLDYYVWKSSGRLETATAEFRVTQIVPIAGAAADRNLAPDYPGITESDTLQDWDPPFPMDLKRIRPIDEQYWEKYRTTPKAFIRLARGRQLWSTRYGGATSIRLFPASQQVESALRQAIDPLKMGMSVVPVRAEGLAASRGATDFGEYFLYFSFFLMVSALLLTGLFFKLGVEQRMREIGVLRALGFPARKIRRLFLLEGAVLAVAGAILGIGVALGYGGFILYGLRTWWVDAVGTRLLSLHVSIPSLAAGAAAGILTGLCAIAWTLRRLQSATPRGLVAGDDSSPTVPAQPPPGTSPLPTSPRPTSPPPTSPPPTSPRRTLLSRDRQGAVLALAAVALLAAARTGHIDQTAGFFGAGALLLIAVLLFQSAWLRSRGFGVGSHIALGLRSATYRPGRSILCIALIASATFLIVSLDAFRRDGDSQPAEGYPFMAESVLPLIEDPNAIANLPGVEIVPFRLRPGDDASCLNLYQPRNPRILAPPPSFDRWPMLNAKLADGAIPAVADANSMTYVLHLKVGDDLVVNNVRFRMVAALHDSIFQGELLISEENFLKLYPEEEGFRFFLLKAPPEAVPALEDALKDYGFDIQSTAARLASFHKVENTYLSTFRALGGLGLVLGTVGLAAILLRNVLERRKELALLRAVGYRPRHLAAMVLAENVLLLLLGLATGTVCALLAVAPAVAQRGGHLPLASLSVLLAAVLMTGLAASVVATAAALRSPLLAALRSE